MHVHHFKLQTTSCHHSVIPRDFSDHAWVPLENPRTAQPPPPPFKMFGLKFWVLEVVFFFVVTDSLPTSKKGKQKHVLGIWNYKVMTGYNYILLTDVFGLGNPSKNDLTLQQSCYNMLQLQFCWNFWDARSRRRMPATTRVVVGVPGFKLYT